LKLCWVKPTFGRAYLSLSWVRSTFSWVESSLPLVDWVRSTLSLVESNLNLLRNLRVIQIWGQILFKKEGMIKDYPKIPYKKNLKMNLYNLKDLWQRQEARDWNIKSIQGSWCYKQFGIQRIWRSWLEAYLKDSF